MVNRLDSAVATSLNAWVGRSASFDSAMALIGSNELLKGAVFVSILWWYWFRGGDAVLVRQTREHLICTLAAGVVGILIARGLALALPFRVRPRFEPELHFVPIKNAGSWFVDWSGFPSDHAVLFAALAFGIGYISKRTAVFASLYTLLVIALPRMYLGYHFLTDILAGLAIGIVIAYCFNIAAVRRKLSMPMLHWEQHHASSFYVMLFLMSYQLATMFNSLRDIALSVAHFFEHLIK